MYTHIKQYSTTGLFNFYLKNRLKQLSISLMRLSGLSRELGTHLEVSPSRQCPNLAVE